GLSSGQAASRPCGSAHQVQRGPPSRAHIKVEIRQAARTRDYGAPGAAAGVVVPLNGAEIVRTSVFLKEEELPYPRGGVATFVYFFVV
ncbi:MAG: hypothetical protein GY820_38045, partial [Gammaproteobacteria bacterium]|nr:hypothetical protein [Gammaproteobacteria bacterium]